MKSAREWFKERNGGTQYVNLSLDDIRAIQADAARAQRESDAKLMLEGRSLGRHATSDDFADAIRANPLVTDEVKSDE